MLKSKKVIAILTLILVMALVFSLTGCKQQGAAPEEPKAPSEQETPSEGETPSEAEAPKDDKIVIGFNQGSSTVDFLKKVGDNIAEAAEREGVELLYAESNFDPELIMSNINTLLLQGAQLIIDFNVNGEVGGNIVDVCSEKGVPVIGIDVEYVSKDGEQAWFFGANNLESGKVAGRALAEQVKKQWGGKIEKLVLFFNSENGEEVKKRLSGIYDGLIESGEVQLAEEDVEYIDLGGGGSDTTLVGMQKLTDFLTAHPDLKHIGIGTVNDQTAQGCFSAVESSARQEHCLIVSHGCDNPCIENLRKPEENCWIGSTGYFPEKYGDYIIPLALDILAGKNPDKKQTMEHVFIDRSNIDQYYPQ